MHPVSLSALTILPCSPLEQIDAALEAGFDGVSLRIFPVMETDVDVMANLKLQKTIKRRLEASGLQVFDVEVVRVTRKTIVNELLPALEFAGALGARRLAVTSGTNQEYTPDDEPVIWRRLEELCVAGDQYGVGVMLEFIPYRGISSFGQALRVVQAIGHPGLGVTLDALHFYRSGGTGNEIRRADPALLACAQLCDAPATAPVDLPREARYGRLFPGEGELPLRDFVSSLPDGLPICVEVPAQDHGGLSIVERAKTAMQSAQQLLQQMA
ncbi:sugar phosphate isomerase/epimerase [Pseudarthrobacter oxydans]|uniref:sugar phosphate isomerase/epimerase family protein n=1 Tax=Pseudarthrobacter oxydans TaxID=1671 RepID=UPI002AA7A918|nr:sugar phosphate isomerase/epimerase [Pseudarthrobacter oxydans]WPU09514.1 sugar phosphate isomerase/epimerase [Pseudarthrobacter oxydans]